MHFTDRDVSLSRRLYRCLIEQDVTKTGFITYGEMAEILGVFHRTMKGALYLVQSKCLERGWPTITVWIVKKSDRLPGGGCVAVAAADVLETARQTKEISWPTEPWW